MNSMLKCVIIDDQPQAVQVLKNYIKKISFLEFSGAFPDAKSAMVSLKNNPADLIFLDIRKSLQSDHASAGIFLQNALVILMSANRKFAFDAFEHRAVDFLVKPLLFERFYMAAERAHKMKFLPVLANEVKKIAALKGGYIFIKEGTRLLRVELDDIYYIMGLKNYVSILTKSLRIVSLMTMKEMEDLLPSHRFIRVHRSYFVAMDKIISVEKQQIHVKDRIIPIGNIYLPQFMKRLAKISNQ
jgi:DNA-binding LytR/AlgR family response regulator